tara:strand:+ start:4722 stop:5498 length:777 start_codon:yes stop_codon:yes gene_type:complete
MFTNNFDPIAINLFSLEIRWYSLAYIFGILLGWIYCKKILIKDKNLSLLFDDLISYIIIGVIIGGRLGYVIFYNPSYYFENIIDIFMIWKGGMSFHGGVLGVILATYYFSKKNKINTFVFLDLIALSAPIGIFLGRLSNFINSELYGRTTDLFWGVKFEKIDNLIRHPSQLYEAFLEGILLFIFLNYFSKKYKNRLNGFTSSLFLIIYSLFRFLIEFTREPDTQLGYFFDFLTMGQLISIVFLIFGLVLFYKKNEIQK